jgi:hypothetical protein
MSVSKGHIGHWDVVSDLGTSLGNGDRAVGQCRAPDLAERLISYKETLIDMKFGADVGESFLFAGLGALPVADMEGGDMFGTKVANGQGGAQGGIHSAGEDYDIFDLGFLI